MRRLLAILLSLAIFGLGSARAAEGVAGGTVFIRLAGDLPLLAAPSLLAPGLPPPTLHEACEIIRRAGRGKEGRIVLDLTGGFMAGAAASEELASTIRALPDAVQVSVLLESVDDAALIVAAACDEVVVAEAGLIMVDGVHLAVDHYRGMLDHMGVRVHSVTSGAEKTAPQVFTHLQPTEAAKEEYRKLVAAVDAALIQGSLRGDLDEAALRAARAAGPQFGAMAVELGLADQAVEPGAWLAGQPQPHRWIDHRDDLPDLETFAGMMAFWAELMGGAEQARPRRSIAVVQLQGMMVDGWGDLAGGTIFGHSAAKLLDDLVDDDRVKAVVIRIDSGGGSASAADRMFQAARRLDAAKPVIALLDGAAASGGYYLAAAAREIHAHPSTVTGSIGVFAMAPDLAETRNMLGVERFSITSGPRADLLSTDAWTDEREAGLRQVVDAIDVRFQALVAERRELSAEQVAALADGKVFLGAEALELGLVDELSDLATAAVAARTAAGIGSALPVELFPKPLGLAAALGLAPAGAQAPAAALSPQQALAQWADLPAGLSLLLSDMRSGRPVVLAWQGIPQIR